MSRPKIEHEPIIILDLGGVPAKLADCRRLHPCSCQRGRRPAGEYCFECRGTGVGPIQGVALTYCPACSRTNRDFDPRLRLLPGDTPRPEPPKVVVPDELVGGKGDLRTMTAPERHEEQRRIARIERLERKRRKLKAKEDAKARKAAERAAEKARNEKYKAKKAAERAAAKARPKYIPPWKQAPPV